MNIHRMALFGGLLVLAACPPPNGDTGDTGDTDDTDEPVRAIIDQIDVLCGEDVDEGPPGLYFELVAVNNWIDLAKIDIQETNSPNPWLGEKDGHIMAPLDHDPAGEWDSRSLRLEWVDSYTKVVHASNGTGKTLFRCDEEGNYALDTRFAARIFQELGDPPTLTQVDCAIWGVNAQEWTAQGSEYSDCVNWN